MARRIETIDIVKGLGIVMVLIGHIAHWGDWLSRTIFCFHMPLFFFVAGFLHHGVSVGFAASARKVAMSLGLPFVWFTVLGMVSCFCFQRDTFDGLWSIDGLYSLCFCPCVNTELWFLLALSVVILMADCLYAWRKRIGLIGECAVMAVLLAGCWLGSTGPWIDFLPLSLHAVSPALLFYLLGGELARMDLKAHCQKRGKSLVAAVLLLLAFVAVTWRLPFTADLRAGRYSPLLLPVTILGIAVAFSWAQVWTGTLVGRPVAWIGRNSLYYFAMEDVVTRAFSQFIPAILGTPPLSVQVHLAHIGNCEALVRFALLLAVLSLSVPINRKILAVIRQALAEVGGK